MAIAVVQSLATSQNTGAGSSLQSGAFGASPVTGNTILVFIWTESNGAAGRGVVTGVNDTAGNTYTPDKVATNSEDRCSVYRASNITGGSTFKITAQTSGNAYITFCAVEVSGLDNSSPLDGAGSTATGIINVTQPHTGAFSTANANDLLIATHCTSGTTTFTAPTGFTNIAKHGSGGTNEDGTADYQIVSATQTNIDPTYADQVSGARWACVALAYKQASAAPAGVFRMTLLGVG
jgi:hypothetical protein